MSVCYGIGRKVECDSEKEADMYEKCKSDLNSRKFIKKLQLLWGCDFEALSCDSGSNRIVDFLWNLSHHFDKV
jgi:hypothetical protein